MRSWFALWISACFCTAAAAGEASLAVREAVRAGTHVLADGTYAVPLIGNPPEWYTPEVRDKVHEASERGLAYDFAADQFVVPAAAPSQLLIRPGTQIFPIHLAGGWCTAGFVFNGRDRIATAGHCTNAVGERIQALAAPSILAEIGTVTARMVPPMEGVPGNDWALIDIDPTWEGFTDADVAIVGGPCGKVQDPTVPLLKYVGHGLAVGTGGTGRAGVFIGSAEAFSAVGAANRGDSGGPVLEVVQTSLSAGCSAGGALGLLTHVTAVDVSPGTGVGTGFFFGTLIKNIPGALSYGDLLPITP